MPPATTTATCPATPAPPTAGGPHPPAGDARPAAVGPGTAWSPTLDDLGTPLHAVTFVVLDLETTGLRAGQDRITEVGAVKVRGGEVLGELHTLVHPGRPIPPAITAVTGITDALVADAPPMAAVLPSLLRFLDDAVFVAHNAPFDLGFLRAAASAAGAPPLDPVTVDTARLARRLLRDEVRDCRLATLARHLRARTTPEHRALADARATMDVLHGLLERAGSLGATTLEDLRELSRSRSDRSFRRIGLVADAPRGPGVYRFLDARGVPLYIGKATDLRTRLRTYFGQDHRRRTADLVRETDRVAWTPTATVIEAEVVEVRELHAHRPRYNRRSTTPERAVYLAVTREAFPRLSIVARPGPGHRSTLGPLPSRRVATVLMEALHDTLEVRPCTLRLRQAQDHTPCVLKELGRCAAPCDGTRSAAAYAADIAALEAALRDPTPILTRLRTRMAALAAAGRYEAATEVRGRLHTAATVLAAHRAREGLAAVAEVVVSAPGPHATEVVVIRDGRLAGSLRLAPASDDATVLDAVTHHPLTSPAAPVGRDDAEELALLHRWLAAPGRRLIHASDGYAEPVAGGAALHTTVTEARSVARQLRRDRQTLADDKVVRRAAPETSDTAGPTAITADGTSGSGDR